MSAEPVKSLYTVIILLTKYPIERTQLILQAHPFHKNIPPDPK